MDLEGAAPMTRTSYVRKTDTVRREPGGLERAVLILVHDGYQTSIAIARVLETSIDNVNGALARLRNNRMVTRASETVPLFWTITAIGRHKVGDEEEWF